MGLRVRVGAVAALLAVAQLATDASAGAPADQLRQFFASANAVIADQATADRPQEKLDAIRLLVHDLFAFREAAEQALGTDWRARTPRERAEFVALFTDVVETSVVSSIASRARLDGGAQVTVLDETQAGDSATVKTAVAAKSGGEIHVDFRMRRLATRWAVNDVAVDGVSLVDNYRAQIRRIIDRSSYAGLLGEMRARVRGAPGDAVAAEVATIAPPSPGPQTAAVVGSTAVDVGSALPAPLIDRVVAIEAAPAAPPTAAAVSIPAPPAAASAVPTSVSATAASPISAEVVPPVVPTVAPPARTTAALTRAAAPVRVAAAPPPAALAPSPRPAIAARPKPTPPSFWVQVGAFRTLEAVNHLAARLGDQPLAFDMTASREPLLRVLVGPFADHAGAAAALRALKARGFQPFIARE